MASRGRVRDRHTEDVLLADQVSSDDDVGTEEDEAVFDATILASGGKHSRDLEDAAAELIELGEPPAKRARIGTDCNTSVSSSSPTLPVPPPPTLSRARRRFPLPFDGDDTSVFHPLPTHSASLPPHAPIRSHATAPP